MKQQTKADWSDALESVRALQSTLSKVEYQLKHHSVMPEIPDALKDLFGGFSKNEKSSK